MEKKIALTPILAKARIRTSLLDSGSSRLVLARTPCGILCGNHILIVRRLEELCLI